MLIDYLDRVNISVWIVYCDNIHSVRHTMEYHGIIFSVCLCLMEYSASHVTECDGTPAPYAVNRYVVAIAYNRCRVKRLSVRRQGRGVGNDQVKSSGQRFSAVGCECVVAFCKVDACAGFIVC